MTIYCKDCPELTKEIDKFNIPDCQKYETNLRTDSINNFVRCLECLKIKSDQNKIKNRINHDISK